MVKVYLVEDEIIIRQSIKNSIDWEKEGYEFVGDASDCLLYTSDAADE